jgi:hypothetical protein
MYQDDLQAVLISSWRRSYQYPKHPDELMTSIDSFTTKQHVESHTFKAI